ncbi:dephospho-CoA kinase [Halalkalibaculum sp. DA384]|uniref:dephospho-CoA kinase n=1 Tax=Halalkalibaculum sp. DA384 TaxID=3373606 RepID=UPI003754E168
MISVGITGGIGSGKTTVCNIWEKLGAFVLNADDLAKKIMIENEEVISEIRTSFGDKAYHPDGRLNRSYLAVEAFQKDRVSELNAIVHPRISAESRKIMETARRRGYKLFVYEAALLFENLKPGFLDYIVLVLADQQKRTERVKKRDRTSAKNVRQRMEKQQDFGKYVNLADFVIYNNDSLEELETRARELYHTLLNSQKGNTRN